MFTLLIFVVCFVLFIATLIIVYCYKYKSWKIQKLFEFLKNDLEIKSIIMDKVLKRKRDKVRIIGPKGSECMVHIRRQKVCLIKSGLTISCEFSKKLQIIIDICNDDTYNYKLVPKEIAKDEDAFINLSIKDQDDKEKIKILLYFFAREIPHRYSSDVKQLIVPKAYKEMLTYFKLIS